MADEKFEVTEEVGMTFDETDKVLTQCAVPEAEMKASLISGIINNSV